MTTLSSVKKQIETLAQRRTERKQTCAITQIIVELPGFADEVWRLKPGTFSIFELAEKEQNE